jgi:NADH dehydrogenase FAD-containing subunit
MGKKLVFVGGGHAHLTSLKNISTFRKLGHQVTLISPSPYHYYSGMGPGMLSEIYHPWEVRFHIRKLAENQGAAFIQGKVVRVDAETHNLFLDSGERVSYDVVSFNTGSEIPTELLAAADYDNLFSVKPVVNLLKAKHFILEAIRANRSLRIVVVGGGPAGVEISANLLRLLHRNHGKGEITLIAGKRLLGDAPDKVRHLAMASLAGRGVEIIEGSHVKAIEKGAVTLNEAKRLDFDFAFIAIGIQPSSLFRDSGVPTGADGGLLVNSFLQSVTHPDIFGGGDCISLEGHPLPKVGVHAVRQNPVLHRNLLTALEGGMMEAFKPREHFLLIFNMGNGKGIFWKKNWVWEGRLAFLLKDYIDRRFMKTFQVSGELNERSDGIE